MQLYGFADSAERALFVQLLGVSGIGPKVALAVVSSASPEELQRAIALSDSARFQAIPGIGKKTAERIVLELEGSIAEAVASPGTEGKRSSSRAMPSSSSDTRSSRRSKRWPRSIPICPRRSEYAKRSGAPRSEPVPGTRSPRGRRGGRAVAAAEATGRVRRAGAHERAARHRVAGREGARRGARPCLARRPAWPREDDARHDHPRGARRRHPHGRRSRARAKGRHGGDPDEPRLEGRPLRRRDPPREPRDRGDPLPGARGLPARHRCRPGSGRADADARPPALHARRRHDPHRASHHASARPLRDDLPARLLRAGRARDDRAALGRHPGRRSRGCGCGRGRSPRARDAACREPHPAAHPRRRRGATYRRGHDRGRTRSSRAARGRRGRARAGRP